ncbi:hypothetical protein ANCCAN_05896 [Ancylostoma caninum]|uniref:Uncharacterized protein n=1 Tax=Ancylostoma caninum TaxID=29170 RepID=A0A368GYJ8_ANCCA|nr:hypothetical protein ANCCAN_05896 [Ancylostoma caninum]
MPLNILEKCGVGISGRRPSVKDINAVLDELRKPPTNPAPRGKKILNPEHARALHMDITTQTINSTLSETADFSNVDISHVTTNQKITGSEYRRSQREALRHRQNMYNEQEMALGGHHDIFNDPCPEFKPREFAGEESIVSTDNESQMAEPAVCAASESQMSIEYMDNDENVARSSQGRAGEGCSTPQCMANNTFAPLREIDVSAVTPLDAVPNEVTPVAQLKGTAKVGNQKVGVAIHGRQNTASAAPSVPSNQNDSMDDVLSRMRRTPKRAPAAAKRTTVNMRSLQELSIVEHEAKHGAVSVDTGAPQVSSDTYTVHQNDTFTIRKDGTFTIHPAASREASCDQREGTYTIASEVGAALDTGSHADPIPGEQQQREREDMFAVPALPTKKGKNISKVSVDEREERLNKSQRKNTSLLDLMDVDVPSPGRALFAARPTKKLRTLAKTPVRSKQDQNDDAMEVSIVMSDISQQPSIASDDGSMVDPVSDPRPSQATPIRAPGFTRRSLNTPRSSRLSAPVAATGDGSLKVTSYSDMTPEQKREVIKKSVERLSQPRRPGSVCARADAISAPHSPYVGTLSANTTITEPVTPFEPIDPRRMIVKNAERSGTARRVPQPRTLRGLASKQALFEQEVESTPRPLRNNLLKRVGDYKPAKTSNEKETSPVKPIAETASTCSAEDVVMSASVSSLVNTTEESGNEESIVVPPPPPATAADSSCVVSLIPTHLARQLEEALLRHHLWELCHQMMSSCVQRGALVSRASLDILLCRKSGVFFCNLIFQMCLQLGMISAVQIRMKWVMLNNSDIQKINYRVQFDFYVTLVELLAESLCTVDTPHRLAPESSKRRFTSDSMEEDTSVPEANAYSSEDSSIVVDDLLEVRPLSRGSEKEEVMILKPRKVVHPEVASTPNVRRSRRNRMKPVRQWLGEQPVYAVSPGGSKTLVGVNEVEVRDKRWVKVKTADFALAQQREMQLAEYKRRMREKRKEEARKRKLAKIRDLKHRHRRGEDLHTTVESIVTSSDEEDIEAIVHVR